MPEVFINHYLFAADAVPVAEAFREALVKQFGQPLALELQERGFRGAPRAYANLKNELMEIWVLWEPERPEVEVVIDKPMERMITVNAAMSSLGGKPRYPDGWWRARRRGRTHQAIVRWLAIAAVVSLVVATIWYLHWWGLLLVIAVTGIVVWLWILALAKSFRR